MSWYRIQDADRDPQALLDPASWVSRTWNEVQKDCGRCQGTGFDGECERCGGRGWYAEQPRRGVSVCRTLRELAKYAEMTAMDLRGTVIVELDGGVSGDDDFDADGGAYLILPEAVLSVTPVAQAEEFAGQLAWDEAHR